jgi:polar amino acid transport system substrate-binding protein
MSLFRRAAFAAAFLVAGLGAASAEWTEVRLGTEGAYPPFNNLNAKGELEGFEIEFGNLLCEKAKLKCTWVTQDWDGIIPALLSKRYDLIMAGMNATEKRREQIDFGMVYTKIPITMMAPKTVTSKDISPEALAGKAIGVQGSTIHANYAEKYFPNSTIRAYPTQEEANLDLANGRLDYVMADNEALLGFINKGAEGACCHIVAEVPRDPVIHGPGVALGFRKEDQDLKAIFDKAMMEAFADGSFKKINDKYFSYDTCAGCGS